ncbi:hypothetical protein DN051_44205 (plasmid) [Streptomyces cadmiisoli]|uniref:Uncharacterized protein n=1 Tax=Streptomyces cadmiisoli TaxID=2184053 RepID=A0A2Z4JF03_9ACTN|nr:hypothetical protein DN051_44205 [Streptomyces cadmiisoli]
MSTTSVRLAAVPPATVQRLVGGRVGRSAAEPARGTDLRPVVLRALLPAATVRHTAIPCSAPLTWPFSRGGRRLRVSRGGTAGA